MDPYILYGHQSIHDDAIPIRISEYLMTKNFLHAGDIDSWCCSFFLFFLFFLILLYKLGKLGRGVVGERN